MDITLKFILFQEKENLPEFGLRNQQQKYPSNTQFYSEKHKYVRI